MRASVACGTTAQRERANHRGGSASGTLPYVVEKPVFDIHCGLVFEIVDTHCLIPKFVSGATFSVNIVPAKVEAPPRKAMKCSKL